MGRQTLYLNIYSILFILFKVAKVYRAWCSLLKDLLLIHLLGVPLLGFGSGRAD